ncbi:MULTISPECIES: SulP family inorganic anion transporter [unclassified Bacillus (in: firmicutes)]|uniref:SulP family inorganic anion transporter n=1 Tax=unclassified Bacillus (in: firmicutes) TaxID=185979 RepID=UPI000BF16788|nr:MULTISPECIES: sulfate permease [unclassified Bacillus (in: firmicutes)]PEJ57640.1 sodium-independent anion transporter [Bacillus sp. AFS002410]PEL08409.1 sodium-independent anion transporter [Bacillus sp. AFS017336]
MKWRGRFVQYKIESFRKDLISGIIVGIIAIPLGMAFAISSGVKPEYGIYTTIIGGILISIFGGSKFQIGGPTGAFIPILLSIVIHYGYDNLLIAGFLAGVFLTLMGIFKMGFLIQFIPRPVTIGFTTGIAVIIFTGQIVNFLGLQNITKHEDFISNMREIGLHIATINPYSLITSMLCFISVITVTKLYPKVPGSLIGLIFSSITAYLLFKGEVPTINSTFGAIPSSIPAFHFVDLNLEKIQTLIGPAFVIAMLGGIESLLSAVVADGMSGSRHNSNKELIGQGIANMIIPFFGGIPATGAIARTATNIKSGAVSPISGIIHGVIVLIILLVFAPFASQIPLASMAPILMFVAWNMSERKEFIHILKTKSSDAIILILTFLLTVFLNLTTAVEVGLIVAVILFVKRMSELHIVRKVLPDRSRQNQKLMSHTVNEYHDCPQISIFTIEGPIFFGTANLFEQSILKLIDNNPKFLILRFGKVPFIDTTGEAKLANIVNYLRRNDSFVLLTGLHSQPKDLLIRTKLYDVIGKQNIFEHSGEAISYALLNINYNKCLGCKHYAFLECSILSKPNLLDSKDQKKDEKDLNRLDSIE